MIILTRGISDLFLKEFFMSLIDSKKVKTCEQEESAKAFLKEAAGSVETFGDWLRIYFESELGYVKRLAMEKLMVLADDPSDATWTKKKGPLMLSRWRTIFDFSDPNSREEFIAGQKFILLGRQKKLNH